MQYEIIIDREKEVLLLSTWKQVIENSDCFKLEHRKPWLDDEDPLGQAPNVAITNSYACFLFKDRWVRCIEHTDTGAVKVFADSDDIWKAISPHIDKLSVELDAVIVSNAHET